MSGGVGFWNKVGDMKLFFLVIVASVAFAADWETIQHIPLHQRIEITTRSGTRTRATFVSATEDAIVVRGKSDERSIARTEIRQVRVAEPASRLRNSFLDGGRRGGGRRYWCDDMPSSLCKRGTRRQVYRAPGWPSERVGRVEFTFITLPNGLYKQIAHPWEGFSVARDKATADRRDGSHLGMPVC